MSVPKARIVLGVDGLEVGVWGAREKARSEGGKHRGKENENGHVESDESGNDDENEEEDDDEQGAVTEEQDETLISSSDDDDDDEPPPSDSDSHSDSSSASSSSPTRSPPPAHQPSHAQIEQTLRNAQRLLARTLAVHEAGGDGLWMADELG
jgi:hypothetical protein